MIERIKSEQMDKFFKAVLSLNSVEECYIFFDDLCTQLELNTMAQRLEVARLLSEHHVYNNIACQTGASTATISRVNRSLRDGNGGYNMVFERTGYDKK